MNSDFGISRASVRILTASFIVHTLPTPLVSGGWALQRKLVKPNKAQNNRYLDIMIPNLSEKGQNVQGPGPEVIKLFRCSTQLSMKF